MHSWHNALRRFILHRRTRYVLCWLLAVGLTYLEFSHARSMFDDADRHDGNRGHALIDFGGQWLIAHMLATGRGHELYLRAAQRQVLDESYPRAAEDPSAHEHDADNLVQWLMDVPQAFPGEPPVGGPLYPPTHALMFAPLGELPPQKAYRLAQMLFLACGWLAGLAIAGISSRRIWWPIATMFVMVFPGFGPSLHLAQNSAWSLAIVLVGWWLMGRGWDVAGGGVWGMLAYKPVWALAFLLVPLLTRRWRVFLAMAAAGLAFVLLTLPFVGFESWLQWLRIGRAASEIYKVDENWVFLSRDLLGIPRRWMIDFAEAQGTRDRLAAVVVGWLIWASVFCTTVLIAILHRRAVSRREGYGVAFVAIGAWATCFHFIYYDVLLAVFPIVLLLADPRRFLRPIILVAAPVPGALTNYFAPRPLTQLPAAANVPVTPATAAVLNSFVLTAVATLILIEQVLCNLAVSAEATVGQMKFATGQHGTPWDTFVMLALWAYCGARILMAGGGTGDRADETLSVSEKSL